MDMVEQPKSDSPSLSEATNLFQNLNIPLEPPDAIIKDLLDDRMKWVYSGNLKLPASPGQYRADLEFVMLQTVRYTNPKPEVLQTLRKVVEGYITKNRELQEQVKFLEQSNHNLTTVVKRYNRSEQEDLAKFKTLSEFEREQAGLVAIVATAQQAERTATAHAARSEARLAERDAKIIELEAQITTLEDELILQRAANHELIRQQRTESPPAPDYVPGRKTWLEPAPLKPGPFGWEFTSGRPTATVTESCLHSSQSQGGFEQYEKRWRPS